MPQKSDAKSTPTPQPSSITKAAETIAALIAANPTPVVDAFLLIRADAETDAKVHEVIDPLVDALRHDQRWRTLIDDLTDTHRHLYRYHGRSLEDLNAATLFVGFLAGVQFALDDFKPKLPSQPIASPPPSGLVN